MPNDSFPITRSQFRAFLLENLDTPMPKSVGQCPLNCALEAITRKFWLTGTSFAVNSREIIELLPWALEFRQHYDVSAPLYTGHGALWILDTYCKDGTNLRPFSNEYNGAES